MARKKATARLTLEEIKSQEGRFIIALLGLPESESQESNKVGALSLEESRKPGMPKDVDLASLYIPLFVPTDVDPYWLDNYDFQNLYDKYPNLRVYRADRKPDKVDFSFPPRLDKALSDNNKQTILRMCTTPYWGRWKREIDELIGMNRHPSQAGEKLTEINRRNFRVNVMVPFLMAWKLMEERLQNRKPILKLIQERLNTIESERTQSLPDWLAG